MITFNIDTFDIETSDEKIFVYQSGSGLVVDHRLAFSHKGELVYDCTRQSEVYDILKFLSEHDRPFDSDAKRLFMHVFFLIEAYKLGLPFRNFYYKSDFKKGNHVYERPEILFPYPSRWYYEEEGKMGKNPYWALSVFASVKNNGFKFRETIVKHHLIRDELEVIDYNKKLSKETALGLKLINSVNKKLPRFLNQVEKKVNKFKKENYAKTSS